jgi:hypothetical protein
LYITASGDGFGGEFWRNLLKSITMEKYPNTKNLHIHTNGNGWTEKMWNYLSNLHNGVYFLQVIGQGNRLAKSVVRY